jgi:acetyl-CoA synthetase
MLPENFDKALSNFHKKYPDWQHSPAPVWFPTPESITKTNIGLALNELNIKDYSALHRWSVLHFEKFWEYIINKLNIHFQKRYLKICDLTHGVTQPDWLPNAKLNIITSCFKADGNSTAILYRNEEKTNKKISYAELEKLVNRIANSLITEGFHPGDAIAIDMPMNEYAVAIFLGIIKVGCVVVSIADSFAPAEIATRLKISKAKAIFTQDYALRNGKKITLYDKVIQANAPKAIVLSYDNQTHIQRKMDLAWEDFLTDDTAFDPVIVNPSHHSTVLFSSGTTGDPKAIPWTHTTPIKCAADAYFHHNIQNGDILAWPTNLGWMMGPWLVYAALLNNATIALYDGLPTSSAFGEFIQDTGVTMLGLVPSIVSSWRSTQCMESLNWYKIKLFSSSGECSNVDDMFYLMWLANYKPIIEYCGGTEIGGAYITSTVVQPNAPATFTTPTLGLDFIMLDEAGKPANNGEVAIIPPSIGLSNELLNRDHQEVYYTNMPTYDDKILRRHGDQIEKIDHYYRALGRVDDTMNLGGIKTSSAEIERVLNTVEGVQETAAIAITPKGGGPSQLVIFAVLKTEIDLPHLKNQMQLVIKEQLNPLFKIHDLMVVKHLPRTASNKIMRRVLREEYS